MPVANATPALAAKTYKILLFRNHTASYPPELLKYIFVFNIIISVQIKS